MVPIGLTIYLVYILIIELDNLFYSLFPVIKEAFPFLDKYHGIGVLMIIPSLALIGYLISNYLAKKVLDVLENFMKRIPLIGFLYMSLKDLLAAIVGDDRKFDKPVLVKLSKESNIKKLGFVTQSDLSALNLEGNVAVYLPHSYNFSGNVFIVTTDCITPLEANGTDVYKFIVSGGVTGFGDHEEGQIPLDFGQKKVNKS